MQLRDIQEVACGAADIEQFPALPETQDRFQNLVCRCNPLGLVLQILGILHVHVAAIQVSRACGAVRVAAVRAADDTEVIRVSGTKVVTERRQGAP